MEIRATGGGRVDLSLSLEQAKRVYTALFCRLQTGGCTSFSELDQDDLLLALQTFLQREAAAQGIDATDHGEWERFLGITHPVSCPRRGVAEPPGPTRRPTTP